MSAKAGSQSRPDQYIRSCRELLRAALSETRSVQAASFSKVRELPLFRRRVRVYEQALERRDFLRLKTLLMAGPRKVVGCEVILSAYTSLLSMVATDSVLLVS